MSYPISLDDWADRVGKWRRSKKFYTPEGLQKPEDREAMLGKLMLVVTEVAEAAEAVRDADTANFEEEIADVIIRCLDIAEACRFNIGDAIANKMMINRERSLRHGKQVRL